MAELAEPDPGLPDLRSKQLHARPRREIQHWLESQMLTLEDLRAYDRHDPMIVEARAVVIRYLRRHGWSSPMIGRYMHRDHTTVLYHLSKEALQP